MNRTIYIDNLQDEQKQRYTSKEIEVLTPKEIFDEKLEDTDALIVLCELNVDKDGNKINRSDFYGVKLVQELRREKFMGKVLFVSFVSEKYIVEKQMGEIVRAIGHSFVRLPSSVEEWITELKTILLLDKLSHYDIINHFSGENAIIGEKIHSLESKIVLKKVLSQEDKNACLQIIKSTYAAKQQNVEATLKEFEEITDGKTAIQFVKNKCYSLFPKINETSLEKLKPEWSKWKVLWLDDEETNESLLKVELEKRGKLKVELVKTYQEAVDAWDKDKSTTQEICIVIADYRLNDKKDACKKKQGYHFLQYIAEKNAGIGLIAYSGLTRRFLFESFKHYGVQVNIFSKIDFNQENANNIEYLADQIIQLGDSHWMMRNNQPQAATWSIICPNYFIFKESIHYYSFEQLLSKKVRQNLDVFIQNFNKCSNKTDLWNLIFTDTFKVRTGDFPKSSGKQESKIEAVKEVLTIRRFAIGLYAFLKSKKNKNKEILSVDNYGDYLKFVVFNSDKSKNNPVKWDNADFDKFIKELKKNPSLKNTTSKSGLTFDSSWPYGLLPEEYAWLECDSGLDVTYLSDNRNYWAKIESLRNSFKNSFSKSSFLKTVLVEDKISFGKKTVYFNDDFEPFFRSVEEIKGVLKIVYKKLEPKSYNYETQLTDYVSLLRNIRKEIEKNENTQANIKTLIYFIKEINTVSKKIPKEIINIDEEFSYLFAPWEFRVSYNKRINSNYKIYLSTLKLRCKKTLESIEFLSELQEKINKLDEFNSESKANIILKKDRVDIDINMYTAIHLNCKKLKCPTKRNICIYENVIASIDKRKEADSRYWYSKGNENTIKKPKNSSITKSPEYYKDLLLDLKNIISFSEGDFKVLDFTYPVLEEVKSIMEYDINLDDYKCFIAFEYSTDKYPDVDDLDNNFSPQVDFAIIGFK